MVIPSEFEDVYKRQVQNQTFYVVNVRDLNYVLKDLHNLTFLIVLVGLLAGVICVLIAVSFSKDMDRSVKPILNAMDKANEGNMEVRVPEEGMDEFARIGRHFNSCHLYTSRGTEGL